MRSLFTKLVMAVVLLIAPSMAMAGSLDAKYIPADAKWLVHVDVETLMKSQTYGMIMKQLEESEGKDVHAKIKQFGEVIGSRIPDDIHDATLIGTGFDENSAVLVVHGKLDKNRIVGLAKVMKEYTSTTYNGKEISTMPLKRWEDNENEKGSVSGTFLADDVLVVARTPKQIERMIDLAAGKEKTASADSVLAKGMDGVPVMFYLAADGFAELQKQYPVSPILGQVSSARIGISEKGSDIVIKAILDLTSEDVAKQAKGAIDGLKSMLALAAMGQDQDEDTKVLADIVKRSSTDVQGSHVSVELPLPLATVRGLMEDGELKAGTVKKSATTQHANTPAGR